MPDGPPELIQAYARGSAPTTSAPLGGARSSACFRLALLLEPTAARAAAGLAPPTSAANYTRSPRLFERGQCEIAGSRDTFDARSIRPMWLNAIQVLGGARRERRWGAVSLTEESEAVLTVTLNRPRSPERAFDPR